MIKIRRKRFAFGNQVLRTAAWGAPAALLAGVWVAPAGAVGLSWDPGNTGTTTGVSGGNGTWDDIGVSWYNGTIDQPWIDGSDATFAATPGTVTIPAATNRSATSVIFATDGYTITGPGTLTLTGAAKIDTTGLVFNNATIGAQISGSSGLTVIGDGTLFLTNSSNNYTGGTNITGEGGGGFGMLVAAVDNAIPANSIVKIKGSSFARGLTIPAGVSLNLAQVTGFTAAGDQGSLVVNGNLTFGDSTNFQCGHRISGTGTVEKVGSGVVTLGNGNKTFSGVIKLTAGAFFMDTVSSAALTDALGDDSATNKLVFNGGGVIWRADAFMNRPVEVTANGGFVDTSGTTYPYNPADTSPGTRTTSFAGTVTGSGTLTSIRSFNAVSNVKGLSLVGAKSFSGNLVVKGGGLILDNANSAGDNVQDDGTPNTITLDAKFNPSTSQNSTLIIRNSAVIPQPVIITPGVSAAVRSNGIGTLLSNLSISAGQTLILGCNDNNGDLLTLSGEITGAGTISRSLATDGENRGVAVLAHDNSNFSGPVASYSDGVLMASASNQLGNEGANNNLTLDKSGGFKVGASFNTTRSISVGNAVATSNSRAGFGGTFDTNGFDSRWGVLQKLPSASSGVFNKSQIQVNNASQPTGTVSFTQINPAHDTFYVDVQGGVLAITAGASDTASVLTAFAPSGTITKPPAAFGAGAKFDITDNLLIITALTPGTADGAGAYPAGSVQRYVHDGRNAGAWDGTGIVTSQIAATTSSLTSIGVATAGQVKGIAGTDTAVWGGQTVTPTDTLVMYTYGGDANLDGKLNVDDYGHIDSSIGIGLNGWYNGDFNYDGKINVDDYGIINFNIGIQGPAFPTGPGTGAGGLTAVPEPGSIALLGVAAIAFLGRRRRK